MKWTSEELMDDSCRGLGLEARLGCDDQRPAHCSVTASRSDPETRAATPRTRRVQADREAPAARRRELELLAVVRVGQVLDGEGDADAVAAARQVHAPGHALHGEAVERQQVLRR